MPQKEVFAATSGRPARGFDRIAGLIPGVLLCIVIAGLSAALERAESHLLSHPYVEALVLAILVGIAMRSFWRPSNRWQAGIAFSAKQLLEVAVMLLGASISFAAIVSSGVMLLVVVAVTVVIALAVSFGVSRALGLPTRLSILIACGNSICGNSAIAAVAPIIGADSDDIASSIAFTAILGVLMVLGLPLLIPLLQLSETRYGILAGLTVYAVPQVLAATVPAGLLSTQMGTLVKLMRVLMLGPVTIGLSLIAPRLRGASSKAEPVGFFRLVPWFILGFLALAALRSMEVVPVSVIAPLTKVTGFLTVVSMAALGLGVDVRVLAGVGSRVTAAVTISLIFLLGISLGLVHLFK
ncbi:MAG: putative sulfate exporter family transporter [Proteobacteria bacterium]|nr:putative sulfate exporter family transporter [Pseudomonadota bacterium]